MIKLTQLFLVFCLSILFVFAGNTLQAQEPDEAASCFIDLGDIVFPVTTICANEPFSVPCVDFQTTEAGPAGIMWVIYSAQPTVTNPLLDPATLTYNAILPNQNGNPIFSCSQQALFENLNILTAGLNEVCVYLVPVINNDTTNNLPGTCTGVVPGFNYPQICFLNPEMYPETCGSECAGLAEENDNCPDATSFVIAPATYGIYSNQCSTSINDPTGVPNSCFGADPYQATVWFTFTGNGGTYTIRTINCPGSANPQLVDSQMAIYTGSCDGALTLAACNDDQGANLLAAINNFATVAGQVYYILIDGYEDARGEFCLEALEIVAPPACDADYGAVLPNTPTAICQSEGITFTATGAASGGYTSYFVVVNTAGGNIVISNAATTFTLSGSAVGAGNYTVHALNISNEDLAAITPFPTTAAQLATALANPDVCSDFDAAGIAVTVTATPNATALSNSPLCEGEAIQLFGSTATPGTAIYSWTGPGGFTASVQNPQIDNATAAQGGTYILTVAINGCQSAPVLVSVLVNPVPIVTATNNGPVCESNNLTLSAATTAPGTVTYQWNGPGGYTAFTQNPVIVAATPANSGTYSVTAVANGCSSAPVTTEVVVTDLPVILLQTSSSAPCTGTCITLTALTTPGGTVLWTGPEGFTANQTVVELCNVQANMSGSYFASVTLNGCESELAAIDITVLLPDDPACAELCLANGGLALTDDNIICPSETLTVLAVGTTGGSYQTYYLLADSFGNILATQTSGSFSGLASGSYNVYTLNFAAADAALVDAFLSGADISELQTAIANADFCAALSDALSILVLAETSVGCFNCQADGGTVNYTGGEVQVCQNAITAPFNFTANNTNAGYLTYLVITNATTNIILAATPQNTIDWAVLGLSAGSYTVYALNFADAFQTEITTALSSGLSWADFLAAIGGSGYCFDVSDGTTQFVVIAADVSPCAETCFANFGTVIPPADTTLCPDETAQPATLVGAATSGYTTVFLITTPSGGSLTVVGVAATSDFTCPDSGTYFIHALNYANTDAIAVNSAVVPGADVASTLFNLAAANVCYELDLNGYALNCLSATDLACLSPLSVINLVETPAPDGLTYTVSFTVTGGSGIYIINGSPSGSNFVSGSIPCGVAYNFEITDDVASGILIVSGISPCVCPTHPGNMPNFTAAAPVCWGGSITLSSLNPVLIPGDVLIYVLHNGTASNLGTILATSASGNFNFASSPLLTTNTTYYITPIAGPADTNGDLIFADPCTRIGTGAPVVFLEPISFTVNENCDWLTGDYTVVLFPSGGLPQFDSSQTYQITGDAAVNIGYGQSVVRVFPQNETTIYSFTISDNTCTDAVTATEPFVCIKTPIQLLSFKGEVQQRGNLLQWTTATETDNDFFALERSIDAVNFARIATIDGAGTSITTKKYEFLDKEYPAGTAYYRLLQVDFNGSSTTSQVISLKRGEASFGFNAIYPIPADRFVEIAFSSETETPVSIEVYDLVGKLVSSVGVFAQRGNNVYVLPVAELPAGMYLLSINNGKKVISNRFVKK